MVGGISTLSNPEDLPRKGADHRAGCLLEPIGLSRAHPRGRPFDVAVEPVSEVIDRLAHSGARRGIFRLINDLIEDIHQPMEAKVDPDNPYLERKTLLPLGGRGLLIEELLDQPD